MAKSFDPRQVSLVRSSYVKSISGQAKHFADLRCKHSSKNELIITKFSNFFKCQTPFFVMVQTGPNFTGSSPSIANEHGDNQQI